jgi:hypothetical protein
VTDRKPHQACEAHSHRRGQLCRRATSMKGGRNGHRKHRADGRGRNPGKRSAGGVAGSSF